MVTDMVVNSDFLGELYGELPEGTFGWVCHFRADPSNAPADVWAGRPYKGLPTQASVIDRALEDNTYFCTAVLCAAEGQVQRRKENFHHLAALVLDDAKVQDLKGFSYAIQTSPGKFQVGILLDPQDQDCYDRQLVDRVMSMLAARGWLASDRSGNNAVRYVRLPNGSNTKPRAAGVWKVQMDTWSTTTRWTLDDACDAAGINLTALKAVAETPTASSTSTHGGSQAGELVQGLLGPLAGRSYHDNLTRLAASLVSGGMFPGAAVEHLYSLMDAVRPTGPEEEVRRWEARRAEIPRAVKSAEQFSPDNRKPPSITVNLSLGNEQSPARSPGEPQPMDWEALAEHPAEPPRFAIEGWLPLAKTTLLSANGGIGKSNLSLQLAVALATGTPFLQDIEVSPKRVLVISAEDDQGVVHHRVEHICAAFGIATPSLKGHLFVYDMTHQDCLMWSDGHPTSRMQWLADTAVRHKAEIVIIDNASDVYGDNENDRAHVRGFVRCLNTIAGVTGAAVLLLAHVDKASVRLGAGQDTQTTFSGSTAWNNSVRSRWAMVRTSDTEITLRHEKHNLSAKQPDISIEFDTQAKVFRRFGTVPGAAAARALMRSGQRIAVLRLLSDASARGQRLSMSVKANNNAFVMLHQQPGFPQQLARGEFFGLLTDLTRDGLVEEVEYLNEHRKKHKCLDLTEVGRLRVAQGSGAPAMWRGGGDE